MSEKKRIPEIRFNGFESEWEEVKLGEKMIFSNGINSSKENYGIGRKMISVMDILNKKPIQYKNILNSVNVDQKTEQSNKVEKGDLVFVRSSEVVEEVGYCNEYIDDEYALYSGFSILGKKISEYNTNFFLNSLNYKNRKQIERKAGGSTRFNVSQKILNDILLFTPSVDEQNRISQVIKLIDSIILYIEHLIESCNHYKQSMLQKMFPMEGEKVPEIRFEGFEGEWEVIKLSECFDERIERTSKGELISVTMNQGVKKFSELNRRDNSSEDKTNYKVVKIGDIAYNSLRMWQGASGYSEYDGILSPAYTVLVPKNHIDSRFFSYLFKKNNLIYKFESFSEGITKDQWTLKYVNFKKIETRVPSLEEQKQISEFFQKLDNEINIETEKLRIYKELKKTFLNKLFL